VSGANVQAGLLLIVLAVVLWMLFSHGYLTAWMTAAAAALQAPPEKTTIPFPAAVGGGGNGPKAT
jgi:hypothetical protein